MTYIHISWFNEETIKKARDEHRVIWMCESCGAGRNDKPCPNCDILMKEYLYTKDSPFISEKDKHLKLKEKICDTLIGKKFEIVWSEQIEYTTSVYAETEEEAYDKWDNGNHPSPSMNSSQLIDDSLEIIEIQKENIK